VCNVASNRDHAHVVVRASAQIIMIKIKELPVDTIWKFAIMMV
jgi:hypothetical protein